MAGYGSATPPLTVFDVPAAALLIHDDAAASAHGGNAASIDDASIARRGDAVSLARSLQACRDRTLAMLHAWREQLGDDLTIGFDEVLNPMRWEFGHVGWFEEWWLARNRVRSLGHRADPAVARAASIQPHADRWYDSTRVAHGMRWTLDLPPIDRIVDDVARQREATLALLREAGGDDDALYFFRLALHHEHMHAEAWVMMAQQLGLAPGDALALAPPARFDASVDERQLDVDAGEVELGRVDAAGFVFDNEYGHRRAAHGAFSIDAHPVTWRRFLPFVEAGGYDDARWWSAEGRAWLEGSGGHAKAPRHLRRTADGRWEQCRFGRRDDVDPAHAASHLTWHEAQAWCRWAGRALPTEAQWHAARRRHGDAAFVWGAVWEWTATPFGPFDGFEPHPYRDYSQPWFDGRPVLAGASAWTHPQMRHPAYRNFFLPHRADVLVGFRSVAAASAGGPSRG
jgi:ergothioneine biosynthesis protein EgtB